MSADFDNEKLSAWLDGELPDDERVVVDARLAESEALRNQLDELKGVSQLIRDLPDHRSPSSLHAAIISGLGEQQPVSPTVKPASGNSRWIGIASMLTAAAALMLLIVISNPGDEDGDRDVAVNDHTTELPPGRDKGNRGNAMPAKRDADAGLSESESLSEIAAPAEAATDKEDGGFHGPETIEPVDMAMEKSGAAADQGGSKKINSRSFPGFPPRPAATPGGRATNQPGRRGLAESAVPSAMDRSKDTAPKPAAATMRRQRVARLHGELMKEIGREDIALLRVEKQNADFATRLRRALSVSRIASKTAPPSDDLADGELEAVVVTITPDQLEKVLDRLVASKTGETIVVDRESSPDLRRRLMTALSLNGSPATRNAQRGGRTGGDPRNRTQDSERAGAGGGGAGGGEARIANLKAGKAEPVRVIFVLKAPKKPAPAKPAGSGCSPRVS